LHLLKTDLKHERFNKKTRNIIHFTNEKERENYLYLFKHQEIPHMGLPWPPCLPPEAMLLSMDAVTRACLVVALEVVRIQ
jgi:hypothetical protein